MVYVIILSAVVVIIVLLHANSLEDYLPPKKITRVSFIEILLFIIGGIIGAIHYPSALDVYRGKTQLRVTETTISNKVITRDSTVVYK